MRATCSTASSGLRRSALPGAAGERPAAGVLHAEQRCAPPAPAAAAPVGRHQQRAQPGEAVGIDQARAPPARPAPPRPAGAAARCLRPARRRTRRRAPRMKSATRRARALDAPRSGGRGQRGPERRVAARQQGDRRGPHRAQCARCRSAVRIARSQPRPGDPAGEALVVEPGRLVLRQCAPAGSRSPRRRPAPRSLRAGRPRSDRVRALHPGVRPRRAASRTESAGSRARRPARSRRAGASPYSGGCAPAAGARTIRRPPPRREAAAQRKAFGLQRSQRGGNVVGSSPSGAASSSAVTGPVPPAGRAGSRPAPLRATNPAGICAGSGNRRIEPRLGPQRQELRQPLGRDP